MRLRRRTRIGRSWLAASAWTNWSFMRLRTMSVPRSKARWAFARTIETDRVRKSISNRWTRSTITNRSIPYPPATDASTAGSNSSMVWVDFRTLRLIWKFLNQQAREWLWSTYKITIKPIMTAFFRAVSHENKIKASPSAPKSLRRKIKWNQ